MFAVFRLCLYCLWCSYAKKYLEMASEETKKLGYKVCNVHRTKRKGLTAGTLEELIEKGCDKLGISPLNCRVYLDSDGTEVDEEDYFQTLESQTLFMIACEEEIWRPRDEGKYRMKNRKFKCKRN